MCTLSVLTRDNGYLLAMNRDERIARGAGEIPQIHQLDGITAVYPSDGASGTSTTGTWIAANQYGITLALLNWNDVVRRPIDSPKVQSRGQIIPALGSSSRMVELKTTFGTLDLERTPPFRLVGVFPSEKVIGEWRWDSSRLIFEAQEWRPHHWFSSSLSDRDAESLRRSACRNAEHEPDAGSVPWLRRLHGSHAGGPGAFSLCVHRKDVKTLSYSEIMVTRRDIEMGHFRGSPCVMGSIHSLEIKKTDCPELHAQDVSSSSV